MSSTETGLYDLGRLDLLAAQDTPIHRVDPRAKIIATMVFVVVVASFGRYEVVALLPFLLFPVSLAALGNLPFGYLARRLAVAAPFALLVGIWNPLFDRRAMVFADHFVAGGWLSFASVAVRFLLTAAAVLVLVGSTGLSALGAALGRLGVPRVFTAQMLLLYRFLFVLAGEALTMHRAWSARTSSRRAMSLRSYAGLLGQLLVRTYARAARIHAAMQCRGFSGELPTTRSWRFTVRDGAFVVGWVAAFAALRLYDLPQLIGRQILAVLT